MAVVEITTIFSVILVYLLGDMLYSCLYICLCFGAVFSLIFIFVLTPTSLCVNCVTLYFLNLCRNYNFVFEVSVNLLFHFANIKQKIRKPKTKNPMLVVIISVIDDYSQLVEQILPVFLFLKEV